MDPAQGETGGKSLTSKLRARVSHPHVKDKVKNLKNRLPGMKKHAGDEEDSSEYDDNSPRDPGPETGYNVGESTPVSTVKTDLPPSPRGYESRPLGYDTQNRGYVAAAPPTRPAPVVTDSPRSNLPTDSPRSNLAPSFEEKFKYLDVGEKSPRVVNPARSYEPDQQTDPIRSYQPVTQQYSPSTTESMQTGHSDVSYRASPTTPTTPNKGIMDKVRDSVTGAAVVLGDKMGYYNDTPAMPKDPNAPSVLDKAKSTLGLDKPRDPNAPSLVEKTKATLGMDKPRDPNAPSLVEKSKATLGMDKPRDPNAPSLVEKSKATLGMDKPRDQNAPSLIEKTKATLGMDKPRDPNAPSPMEKTKATLGMDKPRDPNAPSLVEKTKATLGMDKPRDPNAPPLTEKAKAVVREYGATTADRAAWTKDRLAAHTTPTQHDKALSEQVTQTLSTLPGAIREKVLGPASPTAATSPSSPGVVDRVSGAVSSLFNTTPKATAERMQHTFPAHSDYPTSDGAVPQTFADRRSVEERMPGASHAPPSYPTVTN